MRNLVESTPNVRGNAEGSPSMGLAVRLSLRSPGTASQRL
jgi:hypothetical protein